jgi:hypothetical protein
MKIDEAAQEQDSTLSPIQPFSAGAVPRLRQVALQSSEGKPRVFDRKGSGVVQAIDAPALATRTDSGLRGTGADGVFHGPGDAPATTTTSHGGARSFPGFVYT